MPGLNLPVHVIHNGITAIECRRIAASTVRPAALRRRRYIVCVAKFEPKKGQDVLIAGFQALAPVFPDLDLVLIGASGPSLSETEALAAKSPVDARILIYPDLPHEETLSAISGAELLVLPSRKEPFGIVLLEAACLDVPVVASGVDGIVEVVEQESGGLLVPPDDPVALGRAMRALLEDRDLARIYARNLKAVVERQFTWDLAASRYAALFGQAGSADDEVASEAEADWTRVRTDVRM